MIWSYAVVLAVMADLHGAQPFKNAHVTISVILCVYDYQMT